jgi:glycosyltransferase involved in cell wall biosynthesis
MAPDLPDCNDRPAIAIVSNSQTPYRLALHRRIARELPEVCLWSLYTHETSNSSWAFDAPAEIRPVQFGQGESSQHQDRLAGAWREWRRGGRVIRWIKQHHIRFVVAMGYNDLGRIRLIRWCRRRGVPCFLFGDSNIQGDAAGLKAVIKRPIVRWIVKSCAGVLPCGTLGREYFLKYGADQDRIFYFPYEPDYGLIENLTPAEIAAAIAKFNLPPGRRIVYSGRLVPHKRVDLLVDAFVQIARQRPEWNLVIVGGGTQSGSLQAKVPAELARRVTWVGFVDDQAAIAAVCRAGDVLVLPSDFEPWALVVNEAVAAGMAVVCSDVVGAAAELVRDGVNGRLFPAGNGPALSAALLDVTDPARIDAMKAASAGVLADWRKRGDPVAGLRAALQAAGVVPGRV